ncbi:MAG TPA: aspartyl-phosphate phosphatase Spo0E family protein [Bacillales bacterium]|jgi:hypothetical protein|nr:aspartyl-phosphate phosphatase Spo0E family protein [Bacillales bacterium]
MENEELLAEIEHSRKELNQLGTRLPLLSREVVTSSQRLDRLLNEYKRRTSVKKSIL